MNTVISVIARPFVFLVFLTIAWGLAKLIHRLIPEGPTKRWLYKSRKLY